MKQVLVAKDQAVMVEAYLNAFSQFVSINQHIPFLEMVRQLIKQNKKGQSQQVEFMQAMMKAVDIHVLIKSGQWSNAAVKMSELSSIKYD